MCPTPPPDASDDAGPAPRRVRAVVHAGTILRAIADASRPLKASEISTRVGLSRTSVFHLLRTLEEERFVARDEDNRFRLSWALFELGGSIIETVELNRIMRRHLERLSEETSLASTLAILEGMHTLYLDRTQVDPRFTMIPAPGRRGAVHATASGKTLLAFQPEDVIEHHLSQNLKSFTNNTICDSSRLRVQLAQIRDQGFATNWQEHEIGVDSLAAPIFGFNGAIHASLVLVSPAHRITPHNLQEYVSILLAIATAATRDMQSPSRPVVKQSGGTRAI